jgi:hypothetical protein
MKRIQQNLLFFGTFVILVIIAGFSSKLIALLVLLLAGLIWIAGYMILFLTRRYRKRHSVTR